MLHNCSTDLHTKILPESVSFAMVPIGAIEMVSGRQPSGKALTITNLSSDIKYEEMQMQTFFPKKGKVKAVTARGHGAGAEYRIALGTEMWGDDPYDVLKIQMSYQGSVSGRKAPSYPFTFRKTGNETYGESKEFDEVVQAVEELLEPKRRWVATWDREAYTRDISEFVDRAIVWLVLSVTTPQAVTAQQLQDTDNIERPFKGVRFFMLNGGNATEIQKLLETKIIEQGAAPGFKLAVGRLADIAGA